MTGIQFGVAKRLLLAAAAGQDTTEIADKAKEVLEPAGQVTEEATRQVNEFVQYFDVHLPQMIAFGIKVLLALVVFFIGRMVIHWIGRVVRHSMRRARADEGVIQFVDSLVKVILYALLLFSISMKFGVESSSVAALIASGGVALGLALQGSLSNFAGGVLILVLRLFAVGDYIIVNSENVEGTVKEIHIFYTKLATLDNKTVIVPNGQLSNNSIINVTASPYRQLDLKVGISYSADLVKAKHILSDLLEKEDGVDKNQPCRVFVDSLADSSVVLGIRAWTNTQDYWDVRWRLLERIKLTFDREGIDIPFPQLSVHFEKQPSLDK